MFQKKLSKFFRGNKQAMLKAKKNHHYRMNDQLSDGMRDVTCYNCNKSRHVKAECPKLEKYEKKKMVKKKAMTTTWSNSEESSTSSGGEHANMCFMANNHEDKVISSSNEDSSKLPYKELEYGFKKSMHAYDKLASKYDKNKKLTSDLNDENDCILFDNECLKYENSELKKIVLFYSSLSDDLIYLRYTLVAQENVLSNLNVSKNL